MEAHIGGARDAIAWSSIPTDILLAELSKRDDAQPKPQCGSARRGSYDTPLHVFALFLVLALSTLACGFPLISRRSSKGGRRQNNIVFLCQHFGTGVLIATAFVHLLPTAFTSLTDPCLPYFFSKGYKPLAGLIAMVFALLVVGIESYLTSRGGARHSHAHDLWGDDAEGKGNKDGPRMQSGQDFEAARGEASAAARPDDINLGDVERQGLVTGVSPLPESTPVVGGGVRANGKYGHEGGHEGGGDATNNGDSHDSDDADSDMDLDLHELDPVPIYGGGSAAHYPLTGHGHRHHRLNAEEEDDVHDRDHHAGEVPATPEEQKRMLLQCLLLEAGILFHSVFIGMALSVATGPAFVVFLIAISFHQSFEGLALGSRIAALHFPRSSPRPWLMVLAYGTTTPVGQAIGLLVHNLYDPKSQTGLLLVGFMNAVSSGLLVFAGLVQLLAEDFLAEKSYETLKGTKRVQAFAAVVAGAGLMAAVGAFA